VRKHSLFAEAAMRRLDTSIHAVRLSLAGFPGAGDGFLELVHAVRSRTAILARRSLARDQPDTDRALAAMALFRADWQRPLAAWTPPAGSMWPVLASLAEHLFARFPMPRFLASVWRDGDGDVVPLPQHAWYLRLGRGESLRRIGLPIELTRAMAHRFTAAPDHLTMIAALRWAQVTTLGGSEPLARAVLATRLGRCLENEAAWEEVVRFFARHPELPHEQIGPLVEFIQHQRFDARMGWRTDGSYGSVLPPRPDFSLKGRTPASLLRLVAAWHEARGAITGPDVAWPRAPIGELAHVEQLPPPGEAAREQDEQSRSEMRVWTISELCSSQALWSEGQALQHCIRVYADACRHRRSSIWSLQVETRHGRRRVATIRVRLPARRIVEARRKLNRWPSQTERAIIARWAAQERLVIDDEAYR
jgi:hypothetical protein